MKIAVTPAGTLSIESNIVSLRHARPVLNSVILPDLQAEITSNANESQDLLIRYRSPALGRGAFVVEVQVENREAGWLRYWLEDLDPQIELNSFGLHFEAIENLRAYLRNGYHSWDGSAYVEPEALLDFEPYEPRPEIGYAMTQCLPRLGSGSLVIGFDRHDRFQQMFTFDTQRQPCGLTVLTLWDQKDRAALARCQSERLFIFEHPEVEAALRAWAQIVAEAAPQPPRLSSPPITGWCSWYNLYSYISEEIILDHLHGAAEVAHREQIPMRVFQIDDGFTPEMGDWLEVKPQFPRGMKPLLDDIRATGFIPGLWIAPFMVGNRSHLYRDHPEWVVSDRHTGQPIVQWKLHGEYRWHKRSEEYYILDTTHPAAFDYLRRVFRVWRKEWSCDYFKTDFMHYGSEYGPDRAVWHTPGLTRIENWRRVAEMIRDEIGEATWLICGAPLWASVGLVDGIRIGHDVGVEWDGTGGVSAQSLLRDLTTRSFANHLLWQIDPDCVLLRQRFHSLTDDQVRALAIYAGLSGGVIMTSDAFQELPPDRLRLWKLIVNRRRATCHFPFLGQTTITYERFSADFNSHRVRHQPRAADPVIVQVRPPTDEQTFGAVFIFNTGALCVERTYPLDRLGLNGPRYVFDWTADRAWPEAVERLPVSLEPYSGALFFISPTPITTAPETLPA